MGEVGSTSVYFSSETPAAEPSVEDFAFQSVAKENSRDLFLALFKFNLPKAFEEVHVDAETHTFAALSSSLRPPGLLLSLHKSILAAAFMNGFIVFLWRRNCKSLRSVLVHIFASTSLPVFVGGEGYFFLFFFFSSLFCLLFSTCPLQDVLQQTCSKHSFLLAWQRLRPSRRKT